MRRRVSARGVRDRRVLENGQRVASLYVTPKNALPGEDSVVVRPVVVRDVQLVKTPAVVRQEQRCTPHTNAVRSAVYPECGVASGDEEFGVGSGGCRAGGRPGVARRARR